MQTFVLNTNIIACFCCIGRKKIAQQRLSSSRCYATKAEALRCLSASKRLFAPPALLFCSILLSKGCRLSGARCFTSTGRRRAQDHLLFFSPHFYTVTHIACVYVRLSVCVCARALTQPKSSCICCLFSLINSNHQASLAESDDWLGGKRR